MGLWGRPTQWQPSTRTRYRRSFFSPYSTVEKKKKVILPFGCIHWTRLFRLNGLGKNPFQRRVYLGFLYSLCVCVYTVGRFSLFTLVFYSLRLSLRSLTNEKGKNGEGLTYCVCRLGFSVDAFCTLGNKRRKVKKKNPVFRLVVLFLWVYRDTS
jgi:hypothetical protein